MPRPHTPETTPARPRRGATAARWGALVASSLLVAVAVSTTSRAAFSDTTANGTNNAAAGTVVLTDDDSGGVVINLTGMKPGDGSGDKCVNVTYTGSLAANVHLYGSAAVSDLAPYLNLTVDVSTGAAGGATLDCTGYNAGGNANLFTGTLATFLSTHANYGNGLTGWDGATNPSTRSYRFNLTLQDDNDAQGQSTNPVFTWEAQSV